MCVTGEFIPQALGVETSLWHTMAPVKYLRLIISLGCELLPEKAAIYQKVHLMSACRETKSSCPFSGPGGAWSQVKALDEHFLLLGQELI